MRPRQQAGVQPRRIFVLALLIVFSVTALTVLFIKIRTKAAVKSYSVFSPLDVELPFAIPCAPAPSDALPVYVALRSRDRTRLTEFFGNGKMVSVKKGMPVRLSSFGATAMVTVLHGPHSGANCFIPSDIVQVIRQPVKKPLN